MSKLSTNLRILINFESRFGDKFYLSGEYASYKIPAILAFAADCFNELNFERPLAIYDPRLAAWQADLVILRSKQLPAQEKDNKL